MTISLTIKDAHELPNVVSDGQSVVGRTEQLNEGSDDQMIKEEEEEIKRMIIDCLNRSEDDVF